MTDPLRAARARLRWLTDVQALIEARDRDAGEHLRHGRHTTEHQDQLAADIAEAQADVAHHVHAAADAITTHGGTT